MPTTTKRRNKRQSNGLYRKSIWTGETKNGRKVYKQISAVSLAELNEKVEAYERQLRGEGVSEEESGLTFRAYAIDWYQAHKANTADNTKQMYENIVRVHFKEASFPICDMTPMDAIGIINAQAGHTATQQKICLTLKQVVRQAMRDEVIPVRKGQNVLDSIPKIRHQAKEKRPLTDDEVCAVKEAAYRYPTDEIFVLLIYGCGLRREEALGLTCDDFNWSKGTVTINKALAIVNNKTVLKEPKTAKSTRILPIPKGLRERLRIRLSGREGVIFRTAEGKLFTNSAYTKMWVRIIEAMKNTGRAIGDDLTAHVFRHNYVTQLCYQVPSISLKKVSQLTGDREDTILKIYNHIIAEKENVEYALDVF